MMTVDDPDLLGQDVVLLSDNLKNALVGQVLLGFLMHKNFKVVWFFYYDFLFF